MWWHQCRKWEWKCDPTHETAPSFWYNTVKTATYSFCFDQSQMRNLGHKTYNRRFPSTCIVKRHFEFTTWNLSVFLSAVKGLQCSTSPSMKDMVHLPVVKCSIIKCYFGAPYNIGSEFQLPQVLVLFLCNLTIMQIFLNK